ncbi:hypothetical protein BDN70DRAFT_551234 [Pholiota conissans]|uniref:Uncharacterized protein n=1 Tax=Pholiota conissans TaxID=109636 RepID=A0A9P5YQ53_9AGAR|nr:hypothetical protein BDN70DRAFT_551234 [Pholiota conissans]
MSPHMSAHRTFGPRFYSRTSSICPTHVSVAPVPASTLAYNSGYPHPLRRNPQRLPETVLTHPPSVKSTSIREICLLQVPRIRSPFIAPRFCKPIPPAFDVHPRWVSSSIGLVPVSSFVHPLRALPTSDIIVIAIFAYLLPVAFSSTYSSCSSVQLIITLL